MKWPWEYWYTMALSFLRLSEETFWNMEPFIFFNMLKQYGKIIRHEALVLTLTDKGLMPEEIDDDEEEDSCSDAPATFTHFDNF